MSAGVVAAVEYTDLSDPEKYERLLGLPVEQPLILGLCLNCGEVFVLESYASVAVYALGERLGDVGPCCLSQDARERLARASHQHFLSSRDRWARR